MGDTHLKEPLLLKGKSSNTDSGLSKSSEWPPFVSSTSNAQQNSLNLGPMAASAISQLRETSEAGVVYLLGHSDVRAKKESWFLKKLIINYVYAFMARNCRATTENLNVPHTKLLEVGMTYMI